MVVELPPEFVAYLLFCGIGAILAIAWVLYWSIRQLIKVFTPPKPLFTEEQRQYYAELKRRYAATEEMSR